MKEVRVEVRLGEYEPLIRRTAVYWRNTITDDLALEDIEQMLRIKAWQALRSYDPTHPRAMAEKDHVFGALRNQVKDLQRKKKRDEEILTDTMPGEHIEVSEATYDGNYSSVPKNGSGVSRVDATELEVEEFIDSLTPLERDIVRLLYEGYAPRDVQRLTGLRESAYKKWVKILRMRYSQFDQ